MSSVKFAAACGLVAVALSGCGSSAKPGAGAGTIVNQPQARGRIDDQRNSHLTCLTDDKLPAVKVGQTGLQIGLPPEGPSVQFLPTPGAAQQAQISGQVQAAEVIGSALLYPNQSSDGELKMVEDCLAIGVSG
jgi:hypothetical protein